MNIGSKEAVEMIYSDYDQTSEWDDATLIAAAIRGDRVAAEELSKRYQGVVKGHIRCRLKDDRDLKDLCQNCWLEIWKRLRQYNPERACFAQFCRFWARITLVRFWHDRSVLQKVEKLESELREQLPEFEEDVLNELSSVQQAPWQESRAAAGDQFDRFLSLAFGEKSPPHHQVALILVLLLEWKPGEVIAELSNVPLAELFARLRNELVVIFSPREEIILKSLQGLERILDRKLVLSQVELDPATARTYVHLRDCPVADTCLADYFTAKPGQGSKSYLRACSQDLSNWCASVKRRVLRELTMD